MNTKVIIGQIAKENGVTAKEVEDEMKQAIRLGMASADPCVKSQWEQIAPDGQEPTLELFIKFCASKLQAQMCS